MAKHCRIHPETELVVVEYCPACRGQSGGEKAAKGMTAGERSKRVRKGARAMWAKKEGRGKEEVGVPRQKTVRSRSLVSH